MKNHIIDTTKKPELPFTGAKIEEHKTMGKLTWNPELVTLYLTEEQKKGYIRGTELREKFKGIPVLNATVFDYLYEHQELIPEKWKKEYGVYFWGTIFSDSYGNLYARYLYWRDWRWYRGCYWLVDDWYVPGPSASLASSTKTSEPQPSALDTLPLELVVNGIKYRKV